MSKQIEALKLALEALEHEAEIGNDDAYRRERDVIREALADSALERMAENERELGLDYMETVQQPYAQTAAYIKSTANGRMHVDPVTGDVSIGKKQPAQQKMVGKWMGDCIEWIENPYKFHKGQLLYTSPPASKPLTDEQIERIYTRYGGDMMNCARAIEREHGIKGDA